MQQRSTHEFGKFLDKVMVRQTRQTARIGVEVHSQGFQFRKLRINQFRGAPLRKPMKLAL